MRASGPKVGSQDWFDEHQMALLFLANTRGGRKMLRIHDDCPRDRSIVRLRPNGFDCLDERHPTFLHALYSMRKPREVQIVADFRCRPKIAHRLAQSWVPNALAWRRYVGEVCARAPRPFRVQPAFAASPLTVYPDPHVEVNTCDGNVWHTSQGAAWATLIAAAGVGSGDSGANDFGFYIRASTTVQDAFWILYRGILLFLTSSIGAGQTITTATLSLYGTAKSDGLVATPSLNIYSSAPALPTALAAGDFDSLGVVAFCDTDMTYAAYSATGENAFAFNAAGIAAIVVDGVTKLGTRNANYDVAATPPPYVNGAVSSVTAASADTVDITSDPRLVVTYTAGWPYVGSMNQLGIGI